MANILPFARPTPAGPFRFTAAEVAETAAWAAPHGPAWGVETLTMDDGTLSIGVVSPSSARDPVGGPPLLAWIIEKTAAGVVLVDPDTGSSVGVFEGLHPALAGLGAAEIERQRGIA